MESVGVFQRMLMRRAGGFVIAVHDIPPERLAHFVDGMRPAQPVHLDELVWRRKAGKSCSGLFAITIDDGVGDNVRALSQLFRARQWPATFYLPTRYLDTGEPMAFQWWWRMKPLLVGKKLQLNSGVLDLSRTAEFKALSSKVEAGWYTGRLESYLPLTLELVKALAQELGIPREELKAPAPITWAEVTRLSSDGLIRFESHGVSHGAMSAMTESELVFEMSHSQEVVSHYTGRECRHLCYPFGSTESIGGLAPRIARRFYDSAVTMSLGSVDIADPWLMPRIPLYPTNSLLFARTKILLKCSAKSAERWSGAETEGRASRAAR